MSSMTSRRQMHVLKMALHTATGDDRRYLYDLMQKRLVFASTYKHTVPGTKTSEAQK